MKFTGWNWLRSCVVTAVCMMLVMTLVKPVRAQGVTTTTVQGTVYLANGLPGAGTLLLSWPAFTTANNQAVAAGNLKVLIGADGFLSVNLAPNLGAMPAGLYYTAVLQMSDGTVSTQYWVVPAAPSATLASVQAQVMPAAQAVQAVSKAYVDQLFSQLQNGGLSGTGGTLTGPLYLCCDPTAPFEAADKHYVDAVGAQDLSLGGGALTGALNAPSVNGVGSPVTGGLQANLQSTVNNNAGMLIPPGYAGTDTFTNANGEYVEDLRTTGSQQFARNVKEFGAACDGVTDDTNALQSAVNYAQAHNVALLLPQGRCKTHTLTWHGESIGGMGKQVSALVGFPGQDILASMADTAIESFTRVHDLTFYVDQSVDVSCSPALGRNVAGSCAVNRPMEAGSIFSAGGNALTGTNGAGSAWAVGNCAIAMPAATGGAGNGLRLAEIENVEIAATGTDPMAANYPGAHSTHTCGLYLAEWPQWSEFRNIDINGLNTGIAIGAPTGGIPANVAADANRWQDITMQVTHGFTSVAGSDNVMDSVVAQAGNSAAMGEPPTGLILDFAGAQQGWSVRNAVVTPMWNVVQPALTASTSGGAVTGVGIGAEHGLGFDPYGSSVPVSFSGACTAQANASVNADGSIGSVSVTAGGTGCSATTTASIHVAGNWDTEAPVNLIAGQDMNLNGGSLEGGNGGYTVWNATGSQASATQLSGGGVTATGASYPGLLINDGLGSANGNHYTGSANKFLQIGLSGSYQDNGLGNSLVQASVTTGGSIGLETARQTPNTASAEFALLGGGAANQGFTSLNDLFLSADDLWWPAGEAGGTGSLFGKDALAPVTGSYVKAVNGGWNTSGSWHVRGVVNPYVLGSGFPAGSGTWYVAAKADAATSQELKLIGTYGSGSVCVFADKTVALTTTWQVFSIAYNTATGNPSCDNGTQGNAVIAQGVPPTPTTNVETAWMAFVPAYQNILLTQQPTQPNQVANKAYVDAAVSNQIANGSGMLPLSGGTMTGALNAPVINGTTNCALSTNVGSCVAGAQSALIPPGTSGSYTQNDAYQATATCVYSVAAGGAITQVNPGALGYGYQSTPAVAVSGGGGSGFAVNANVVGGQVTSYTITNPGSGYTSCPTISVAAPASATTPVPVLDQRKGMNAYSPVVRVDDFGCAGDGVTDDTVCINNAISYATAGGTTSGAISFTSGKNYYVGTVTGYMPTAADDGTAPPTGDTCVQSNAANGVSGSACTNLPPETPGMLGYAIKVEPGLTIYGNGANIRSAFSAGSTTFNMAFPDIAIFASETTVMNFTVNDLNVQYAFVAFASPGYAAYWKFRNVSTSSVGVSILANVLQLSTLRDLNFKSMAGIIVGGWWSCRSSKYNCNSSGDFADNVLVDNYLYSGMMPSTPSGGIVANQAGLDSWFNTYFFHLGDNSTRLTDSQYAGLGMDTDSYWRGIFGIGIAYYSRYGRASNGNVIHNMIDKVSMSYPVVITTPYNNVIDTLSGEDVGECNYSTYTAWGTPGVCPNPYDSADNQLQAAILFESPSATTVRNVLPPGIDAEAVVGMSWRYPQYSVEEALRQRVSVQNSYVASRYTANNPMPETSRTVIQYSDAQTPTGLMDSGESCYVGLAYNGGAGMNDTVCMRNASSVYNGAANVPRYFVIENEATDVGMTGPTGVQLQGLRVRPGLITNTDATLPVSDFAAQSFTLTGGSVGAESCATISGINLPGAATTDGVMFVKAPGAAAPMQLSGQVTAAGVMTLNLCNPTTAAINYPSGTYAAFLMNNAAPSSAPAASGSAPALTGGLTSAVGDLVTANSSGNPVRLPGNTSAQMMVLTSTGNGSGSATPVWTSAPAISGTNIYGLSVSSLTNGTLSIANGGTGASNAVQALANLGGVSVNASSVQFGGEVTGHQIGGVYQVDQFAGADFGAKLSACINGLLAGYGGVCDARALSGAQTMGANVSISTPNVMVYLPCGTITTSNQILVTAGTRNVVLHGCTLRGASTASGTQGGTVIAYTGSGAAVQVGDPTYAVDTMGFQMDDVAINTTGATSALAQALVAYRTQELDLESMYLLGNSNQTGMTLDGTGNYTGGSFMDLEFTGYATAVNGIGHQISNPATTDWLNASTFLRLHIDCPTSGGSPIAGTYGVNLQQGDGNTFTGGDVEGCTTMFHFGVNAQNNTVVGLRNENSTSQYVADPGSSYNAVMTGGTFYTGEITDNGTHNSFTDAFHRGVNGLNGDLFRSQADATVTNHAYLGIGLGHVRGSLTEYTTDLPGAAGSYQNAWTLGLSDGTSGEQFWQVQDLLNNVSRISVGQYNNGSSTNSQTVVNAAGTGAVVLNGSNNAGTGGVVFGSGGAVETTVGSIDAGGNASFNGNLLVGGTTTHAGSVTVKNQQDAEIDSTLWAGLTTAQKESVVYKDWNGASEWYLVKDGLNNWSVNSAVSGIDSFKAYQSTNSGDTYVNANASGAVRVNYESGSGSAFNIYSGGGTPALIAGFTGTTSVKLPGLAAASGHACLQIDNSGFITNTGSACGSGGGGSMVYPAAGVAISTGSAWGASLPLAGAGAGVTTGPTSGTVANQIVVWSGTNGQIIGSGVNYSSLAPLASPTFSGAVTLPDATAITSTGWTLGANAPQASSTGFGFAKVDGTTITATGGVLSVVGGGAGNMGDGAGTATAGLLPVSTTTAHDYTLTPTSTYTLSVPTLSANDTVATLGVNNTFTGKITTAASTSTQAGLNIPLGTVPTTPVNGDMWGVPYTAGFTGLYWRNSAGGNVEIAGVNFSNYFTNAQQWRSGGNAFYAPQGANGYVVGFNGNIFTGGTGASTVPYMLCGNGATAVTTWSTSGTWFGCNAAGGFNGNFLDFHVNGGASVYTVTASGAVLATGRGNLSSLALAAGLAAGSGPTLACAANTTCGWNGGTINLQTGTSPSTGALLTVTDTLTHAKYPSCTYQVNPATSAYAPNGAQVTTNYPTNQSYTVQTLNVSTALVASSYYVINYTCSGI